MTKQQQQLVEENMKLVHFVIKRYYPWHIQDEDVIQIGMIGLCRAAEQWDAEKGAFSTYATYKIRGAINHEFRKCKKQIKTISLDDMSYGNNEDGCLKDFLVGDQDVDYVDTKYFMSKLTPLQQQIFDMKLTGLRKSEIARELNFCREYIGQQMRLIQHKWNKYMGKS
jgi:RNA polymerase sporulation-specific sigma factor